MSFCKSIAAAAMAFFIAPATNAAIIDVEISGLTNAVAGGPYTISGGFSFDDSVVGATSDSSMVALNDPGVFDFSIAFSGGTYDATFTDNTLIASGASGAFDLSADGIFRNIMVGFGCLQASSSGTGACTTFNTSDVVFFDLFGILQFSPAAVSESATDDITMSLSWEVSTRAPEPVPLPAGLPLVLTGLAGLVGLRMRTKLNVSPA